MGTRLDELLRRLAVAGRPDLVDHRRNTAPRTARSASTCDGCWKPPQQRPLQPVRQRVVRGQAPPGLRLRLGVAMSAVAIAACRSPPAVRSLSSSALISASPTRAGRGQRLQDRPAHLGADGQAGGHAVAGEPTGEHVEVGVGASGRRRTTGPRRAGIRCPARRRPGGPGRRVELRPSRSAPTPGRRSTSAPLGLRAGSR